MSIKRKRSTGSLFTASTFEASPTPFSSSPYRLPEIFVQSKTHEQSSPLNWKPFSSTVGSEDTQRTPELNSRTRKRYRDGRPEEAEIHASTVEKLFSAQKEHPHASPLPSQQSQLQPDSQIANTDAPQRSTLHSFWHLPQNIQLPHAGQPTPQQEVLTCDGCDGVLVPEYSMDTLDIDTACGACGKHVCNTCAVAADMRLCLDCAMQS
ncbi:hypothetical protein AUEXF2481DRAFT_2623 [Aureobasidium subglaciale EXF-2481]|uniref:Uncharacterized protein n=1 Tax=Aureobasidium subglaciale (strain EXF-2481) TaxID=1043005 RepID=A0A074YJ39_AURSE|nr:uncharacterized protein AUEXF2481DRAFT_2623 [Aureobasidium subglaciale EXF-2481]KEQ97690.1 hypothetical protein AUEXF2481DRAFT_2623 [Aureobasidium subglaciale EXF-2481]